ncbi:hypothetical protein BP6252_11306 [Coleophoma cylindrospora]|uniref:SMP-30/Gluconolactonase/LRE-like region domain-containing protein n=1 Tax=Coleophoma cylindrospora TaxID=1849047 RepID=A0A3D8QPW8_9HELO|nr:hypothetical protein BP6252_11306 [Coleophoma cylindrospora]
MASINAEITVVDNGRAVTDAAYARSVSSKPSFVVYHEDFHKVLGNSPQLTLVESRDYQFAHEAGVYNKATKSVYFTSNFQTSDPVELSAVNCETFAVTKLDFPEVVYANGACQYQDHVLYCVQGSKDVPSSLVLVDPVTSKSTTLINNFYGREFSSINDVVIHHPTGDIWFTDPTYGYEQGFRASPDMPVQLYRFRPSTSQCWMVADGFTQCNGLCFSPDYKSLYVTDTGAVQAHNGPGDGHSLFSKPRLPASIYVYDVVDQRVLANRRAFAFCDTGVPDGIKCDEAGNVYSGCGDGVHVWDPQGSLIGKIITGGVTANFCFAKDGMWMMCEKELYFCRLKEKGALVKIECE